MESVAVIVRDDVISAFLCRVVYNEVMQTSRYFLRDVSAIESSWLVELAPHFYRRGTVRTSSLTVIFL